MSGAEHHAVFCAEFALQAEVFKGTKVAVAWQRSTAQRQSDRAVVALGGDLANVTHNALPLDERTTP